MTPGSTDPEELLSLSLEYSALARCFSSSDEKEVDESVSMLASLGSGRARPEVVLTPAARGTLGEESTRLMSMSQGYPYEAAYEDESRRLAIISDAAGFYRAFGLAASGERPDSVVAELEFLAYLALLEARGAVAGEVERAAVAREARASFISEHAGRWLGAFSARLAETSRSGFHQSAAARARTTVLEDARALGAEVQEVGDGRESDAGDDPCKGCPALGGPPGVKG